MLKAFEIAEIEEDPSKHADLLTFVLIGGGPTGVELAGALAELRRFTLASDFRRIDPQRARVLLAEHSPRILKDFPEGLSAKDAAARMKRSPYYVQKLYAQARNFSPDELRHVTIRLAKLDLTVLD